MAPPAQDHIQVSRELHVVFPAQDTHRAISKRDWARLKRMIEECPVHTRITEIVYSIAFAFAVSAGLTIIPLYMTQGRPAWVMPTYVIVTLASAVIGVVFVLLDEQSQTVTTDYLELIETDMEEIESSFVDPPPQSANQGAMPPARGLQDLMADKQLAKDVGAALQAKPMSALAQAVEQMKQEAKARIQDQSKGMRDPPPGKA